MDERNRQALSDIRAVDVLIHAYDQVDLEEVWMAYQRFPDIRRRIDAILSQS